MLFVHLARVVLHPSQPFTPIFFASAGWSRSRRRRRGWQRNQSPHPAIHGGCALVPHTKRTGARRAAPPPLRRRAAKGAALLQNKPQRRSPAPTQRPHFAASGADARPRPARGARGAEPEASEKLEGGRHQQLQLVRPRRQDRPGACAPRPPYPPRRASPPLPRAAPRAPRLQPSPASAADLTPPPRRRNTAKARAKTAAR